MLSVCALSLRYPAQSEPLIRELSFDAQPGELVWLRGGNGSGKTSLLNALSGVTPHRVKADLSGGISLDGTDLSIVPLNERFRFLAYQMADPDHQIFFPRLTKELSFALENAGLPAPKIAERIDRVSALFGLERLAERQPSLLSRGEKKLLVLASCAALDPPLYLLDEPCAALDAPARKLVCNWLRELRDRGRIVVAAEHDPTLASLATQTIEFRA